MPEPLDIGKPRPSDMPPSSIEAKILEIKFLETICTVGGISITTCWPERVGATGCVVNISEEGKRNSEEWELPYWDVVGALDQKRNFNLFAIEELVICTPLTIKTKAKDGSQAFSHVDLVTTGGVGEPAFVITYATPGKQLSQIWKTPLPDGRYGQEHHMRIILPQTLAAQTMKRIDSSPQFIRTLDEMLTKKALIIKGFSPNLWEHADENTSLRPPLEKVANNQSGQPKAVNMYIYAPGDPLVFDPKRIRRVPVAQ